MADPRFYRRAGPFTLSELASHCGAELQDDRHASLLIEDVGPLETAGAGHIAFLDNKNYVDAFRASAASSCLIRANMVAHAPDGMALIICKDPYRAYAMVATKFYPPQPPIASISPQAVIDPSATIGEHCQIDAGAVIGAGAEIGPNCWIGANSVIGAAVVIGRESRIGPLAMISHAVIGARAILHPGVKIGQDGFGFAMAAQGHLKVPQLGRVMIGDDVEIGANSTIDRGAGPDTIIGDGCKIDNLVQIGHNVQLGRGCVLVAQVGVSGSTRMGDMVIAAGQAGITGHLKIGAGAKIGAQSGVMRDVAAGETVGGSPAVPMLQWLRQSVALGQMAQKKGR